MKGRFRPKNPQKYSGNPTDIIYRSSWELKLMMYLDEHSDVLSWGSEELRIRYRSPIDNRVHTYFPDFVVTKINSDGKKQTMVIEVKPAKQTVPPPKGKKVTRKYLSEVKIWGVNQAKWKACHEYCADRKWQFQIFTEKELGLTNGR